MVVILALLLGVTTHAKEWRGITPLHSTRADVERLLGPAEHDFPTGHSIYRVDRTPVEIVFVQNSGERCSDEIRPGTVLSIFVDPTDGMSLADFKIDLTRMKRLSFENPDYRAYYDKESGFLISLLEGRLTTIWYLASADDMHLCPKYYRNPKHFAEIREDF